MRRTLAPGTKRGPSEIAAPRHHTLPRETVGSSEIRSVGVEIEHEPTERS
jgi:hypothetical protein